MADLSTSSDNTSSTESARPAAIPRQAAPPAPEQGSVESKVLKVREESPGQFKAPQSKVKHVYQTAEVLSNVEGEVGSTDGGVDTTVAFVSEIRAIRIKLFLRDVNEYGEDVLTEKTVVFADGAFRTADAKLIEAMRESPNFGGSVGRQFADRPTVKREPLFWEGAFPADIAENIKAEKMQITADPDQYDLGSEY